ncbi:MAG: hypothetical protein ACP5HK_06925 [Acidilobus sp.]
MTSDFVTSGAVFDNVTIQYSGAISWSVMEGIVRVYWSDLSLDYVDSEGVIVAFHSNLTLRYSTASTVVLVDSSATLFYSDVGQVIVGPNSSVRLLYSRVGKTVNATALGTVLGRLITIEGRALGSLRGIAVKQRPYSAVTSPPTLNVTPMTVPNTTEVAGEAQRTAEEALYLALLSVAFGVAAVLIAISARRRRS